MRRGRLLPRCASFRALFFVAFFLLSTNALAQRVLVLRPPESDATLYEAFGRLRAELTLDAFEVVVLASDGRELQPDVLEAEAQRKDAFAAIALTRKPNGAIANVCIVDRVTGKISQRRLSIDAKSDTPTLLAVRAVDLLRASLRELDPGERPPAEIVGVDAGPAPIEVRNFSAEPNHFELRAGALGLGFGAALGAAYGPALAAEYRPTRALAVGVLAAGPLIGARYTPANGSATVRQELVLARTFWNVLADTSSPALRFGPMVGAGVYHLEARGEVDPPLVAQSDEVWSFAASGGLEASLALTSAVSLGAGASCLWLTPRPVVAVDDRSAEIAFPLVAATVGLGVGF